MDPRFYRPRRLGDGTVPAGAVPSSTNVQIPQVPIMHVRDRATHAAVPVESPESVLDHRRKSGTDFEQRYGMEYLRRKKIIRPFDYTTDGVPPFVIPANATVTALVTINKEADFELSKLMCVCDVPALGIVNGRNDDFTFRIKDDRKQQYLMNAQIHNIAGTGTGLFPLILPEPKFMPRSSTISIEMTNRRAVQVNAWWTLRGKNYYAREYENLTNIPEFAQLSSQAQAFFHTKNRRFVEPYFFTTDTAPVTIAGALGQAVDQVINIRQEGDFEVFALSGFSSTGPYSVLIRESNTGRFLMSRTISSGGSVGDGERPALLDEPLFIDSNSQLLCTFTDLSNVAGNQIFFTLLGRKIFDAASLNLTSGSSFFFDKYTHIT